MGQVISLEEFREKKWAMEAGPCSYCLERPRINDAEILARDYSELDNIIFGILKIRQILSYYVHTNDEWQYLILCLLNTAYDLDEGQNALLHEATLPLKQYILDEMDDRSKRDMTAALLILDLIEKTPVYKTKHQW